MEKEVEIFATNITSKTECKSIIAKEWKHFLVSRIPDDGKVQ
jgi:hypothetical protein